MSSKNINEISINPLTKAKKSFFPNIHKIKYSQKNKHYTPTNLSLNP